MRLLLPIIFFCKLSNNMIMLVREDDQVHLVVTCAVEQALVYRYKHFRNFVCLRSKTMLNVHQCSRSISRYGLVKNRILPLSGDYDSVLCSHAMDVDWDGQREIIIGTYGRQVIIYKESTIQESYFFFTNDSGAHKAKFRYRTWLPGLWSFVASAICVSNL